MVVHALTGGIRLDVPRVLTGGIYPNGQKIPVGLLCPDAVQIPGVVRCSDRRNAARGPSPSPLVSVIAPGVLLHVCLLVSARSVSVSVTVSGLPRSIC